ncbi:right-handed parallel beta-helix repeat-containing protein [Pseudoflavitalea sp. G-6-1-2]|uniref:right-handed parallel beta-helix repeat-containing protein n=1 Tax=Pseudoflavitalea sp. G-6-1-2 TaxID=2728841 RepID=UPI00146F3CED|nr:right-handed parallel beta-helix repeat-containing protein [Pseudoflavitalea sp. G-6-1-2]NML21371.1 right-handed parallel beta-helix repeat-containing protein [Pseudoflavitalea sp. G-6-1-2]
MRNILILSIMFCSIACKREGSLISNDDNSAEVPTGVSFYVDGARGNDKNSGRTPDSAWKTIQKSFNAALAGSTVNIKGGIYYEELSVNVSGTASNPITFTNYNNEQVVIDGSKISGTNILTVEDKSNLIFSNITVQNITKNNAMGVLVTATKNGKAGNITFRNMKFQKINWTSNPATLPKDSDNAQPFVAYGYGTTQANAITNLVIDGCEFSNNIPGFSETVSIDGNVDGFTVTNNKVHDNSNIGIAALGHYKVSSNTALDQARNGVIRGNTCYKNLGRYATSGGIYVDGGLNIVVDRNITYQNGYGIEIGHEEYGTASNILVTNNLIYQNQVAGVAIGGYDTAKNKIGQVVNSTIRNNSFIKNSTDSKNGAGEIYITRASNCKIVNNVFYTNEQNTLLTLEAIFPQTGNTIDYNNWFTTSKDADDININWHEKSYESFAAYRTETKQDAHSFFKDPLYTSISTTAPDFHLKTGSAALRTGNAALITDPSEKDYDGKPRVTGGKVDMGAYQKQ